MKTFYGLQFKYNNGLYLTDVYETKEEVELHQNYKHKDLVEISKIFVIKAQNTDDALKKMRNIGGF